MDGFRFAGVHTSDQHCWYHPDAQTRGDDMEDYEISDLTPDNRDGGYYIGSRVKSREFELECYFEDITEAQQERIYRWLRRDTQGELVFDHKPYAVYHAVVSKKIGISLYDHENEKGELLHSGTLTVYLTCYDPFGRMEERSYDQACDAKTMIRTGILPSSMMPAVVLPDDKTALIYNPGTERTPTIIRLAGDVGDGLLIRNYTTGQRCKAQGQTADGLLPGAHLELDSRMGQTRTVLGDEIEMAFGFHDEGYIELAPCTPFVRSVIVTHTAGSNIISSQQEFLPHMEGQYIYIGGWLKIRQVTDSSTAIISENAETSGATVTPVVTMNELAFEGDTELSKLEIDYTPRVR